MLTTMMQNLPGVLSQWLASPVFVSAQLSVAYVLQQLGIPLGVALALWLTISRHARPRY